MESKIPGDTDIASAGQSIDVLFVCTGNICRSPTAEGVFRKLVAQAGLGERIGTDSAGTHGYHVGEPPDPRAQAVAAKRGYDLSVLRARRIERADFQRFDLILAMDHDHHAILSRMAPAAASHKLRLMMSYARRFRESEVPDPYYGGPQEFERVLDMLEDAAQGLLSSLGSKPALR
jgi:protein-tyrosine phosphatase